MQRPSPASMEWANFHGDMTRLAAEAAFYRDDAFACDEHGDVYGDVGPGYSAYRNTIMGMLNRAAAEMTALGAHSATVDGLELRARLPRHCRRQEVALDISDPAREYCFYDAEALRASLTTAVREVADEVREQRPTGGAPV